MQGLHFAHFFLPSYHETKKDPVGSSWGQTPISPAHLLSVETFSLLGLPKFQRATLIRAVRKCRNKDKQLSKTKP